MVITPCRSSQNWIGFASNGMIKVPGWGKMCKLMLASVSIGYDQKCKNPHHCSSLIPLNGKNSRKKSSRGMGNPFQR